MQTEEAKKQFKKLKIHTLLDLALIVPSGYNDTTLSQKIEVGSTVTVEATVEEMGMHGGKLRVRFVLPKFGRRVSSTFFRASPYHYNTFKPGSHHTIQGRLEEYRGYLQIPQPRAIKEVGTITPKYKTPLKESDIRSLIATYVTERNLFSEGLESREVAALLHLHFPRSIVEVHTAGAIKPEFVAILKFIEAYNHLRKLRGKRHDYPAMAALRGEIEPFVAGLPFVLTDEQQATIAAIREDLAHTGRAAKRMVVGDVGSGKTMVILAAAMMARPHRSILMAPTSLLARQLYEEAQKHLPDTVEIALVMQGHDEGDYREADFIIGTHALLYLDDLPVVPLVMVDEQHRFGTRQRQELEMRVLGGGVRRLESGVLQEEGGMRHSGRDPESHDDTKGILNRVQDDGKMVIDDGKIVIDDGKMVIDDGKIVIDEGKIVIDEGTMVISDSNTRHSGRDPESHDDTKGILNRVQDDKEVRPHFLQFSATPIPRTQAMMESEMLDVSLITRTPFEKRIATHVVGRSDFSQMLEQIRETIGRNEQVLIVYPLVEESAEVPYQSLEEARGYWESHFENVYITHGKDKDKEAVLLVFREEGDILLATTVVEVGISLPRLTLIVIVGAERLGLATLHQLRGRVGRHGQESLCYLFANNPDNERLLKFAQTNNGFEIARLDLQYRDSGDILDGTIQSGQRFRWLDMAEDEEIIAQAKERIS
jgi:RecG-like helicase